jgi:hypothetical protein
MRAPGSHGPAAGLPIMPIEIQDRGEYLFGRLYGVISRADLVSVARELQLLEAATLRPKDRVFDLTQIESLEVGFPEVFTLARERGVREVTDRIRSAIIASRPIQVGYARMFEMLNDNPLIDARRGQPRGGAALARGAAPGSRERHAEQPAVKGEEQLEGYDRGDDPHEADFA